MQRIKFSKHALEQMEERGTRPEEVEMAIREGEDFPAKLNRRGFRLNFKYDQMWGEKFYRTKQVVPIVKEEPQTFVVITVYVLYF